MNLFAPTTLRSARLGARRPSRLREGPRAGRFSLIAFCSLVLAGGGCGASSASSANPVTRNELPRMVLSKSALGPQAARLRVNPRFGFLTNAQSASADPDPAVTAASLTNGGRLFGYARAFRLSRGGAASALLRGAGLLQLSNYVDVYRDATLAEDQRVRSVEHYRALVGKTLKGGAVLESSTRFSVEHVGDAATGLELSIRIKGFRVAYTTVGFRYGRLLAAVTEARADRKNVDETVASLAEALRGRIKDVLAHEVSHR
jgi:hypothetical protein